MTTKDYLTLTISILALVISASTAYFNLLRREENVAVGPEFGIIFAVRDKENAETLVVSTTKAIPLVFINSGNQPAVIMSATFEYNQLQQRDSQCAKGQAMLNTDLQPFVLKPADVTVMRVKISDGPWYEQDKIRKSANDQFSFAVLNENRGKNEFLMQVCLGVNVATPSGSHSKLVPIFLYSVHQGGGWSYSFDDWQLFRQPAVLVEKVGMKWPW